MNWREIEGSHLEEEDTRIVSIKMFLDLLQVRLLYMLGLWKVAQLPNLETRLRKIE